MATQAKSRVKVMQPEEVPSCSIPADLREGQIVEVNFSGQTVALCRSRGALFAFQQRCPHAGARLVSGFVDDAVLHCPLHGARFDLTNGRCLNSGLRCHDLKTYPAREHGGSVWIDIVG